MAVTEDWDGDGVIDDFNLDLNPFAIDLVAGLELTVVGVDTGDISVHVLEPLTYDVFDVVGDVSAGTADPAAVGRMVNVGVGNESEGCDASATIDAAGDWSVDWTSIPECPGFDLTADMGGSANLNDETDGDSTQADSPGPRTISGSLTPYSSTDAVTGRGWAPDAASGVMLTVKDGPGGTVLLGPVPVAVTEDWDGDGLPESFLYDTGLDLVAGLELTVVGVDTGATSVHLLEPLTYDTLDVVTESSSGTADPSAVGRSVRVSTGNESGGCDATATIDAAGDWSVDWAALPECPGFDVTSDMGSQVQLYDETDGDSTTADAPPGPECNGLTVTVNIAAGESPTEGDDVILGTDGVDNIDALGGNDTICGLAGNDTLAGGPGDDTIFGDEGNDRLKGQQDNDTLYGGPDDDLIVGGGGDDTGYGEAGIDDLKGGSGVDTLDGGAGEDEVRGGSGNDILTGGTEDDVLNGGQDLDIVSGGPGNDTVNGAGSSDIELNGDEGNDLVRGGNGGDVLNGGIGNDQLLGVLGADTLNGGPGDDDLRGGVGNDDLNGDEGDDDLRGGSGIDDCDGGTGGEVTGDAHLGGCETLTNVP